MNTYKRHRFPPDIISYAVWLYYRFNLSHRDIEDLLAERDITVSREAIRLWCIKFGAVYASRLKRKHRGYGDNRGYGDTFFIDEVFIMQMHTLVSLPGVRRIRPHSPESPRLVSGQILALKLSAFQTP